MPTLTGTQNERRALNVRGKRNATPSHAVVMSLAPSHRGAFSLPIANHPRAKMARRIPVRPPPRMAALALAVLLTARVFSCRFGGSARSP
jgi:hypothetical protein